MKVPEEKVAIAVAAARKRNNTAALHKMAGDTAREAAITGIQQLISPGVSPEGALADEPVMCGQPALFIVEVPDDEIASRVCEPHLPEAVRAANVDFGYGGANVHLLSKGTGFTCEWALDTGSYAEWVGGRGQENRSRRPGISPGHHEGGRQ